MSALISVQDLRKHYRVAKRESGLRGAVRQLFAPRHETVRALDGVSFAAGPEAADGRSSSTRGSSSTTAILRR